MRIVIYDYEKSKKDKKSFIADNCLVIICYFLNRIYRKTIKKY